jgi:hypothetical protein
MQTISFRAQKVQRLFRFVIDWLELPDVIRATITDGLASETERSISLTTFSCEAIDTLPSIRDGLPHRQGQTASL